MHIHQRDEYKSETDRQRKWKRRKKKRETRKESKFEERKKKEEEKAGENRDYLVQLFLR